MTFSVHAETWQHLRLLKTQTYNSFCLRAFKEFVPSLQIGICCLITFLSRSATNTTLPWDLKHACSHHAPPQTNVEISKWPSVGIRLTALVCALCLIWRSASCEKICHNIRCPHQDQISFNNIQRHSTLRKCNISYRAKQNRFLEAIPVTSKSVNP